MAKQEVALEIAGAVGGIAPRAGRADGTHDARRIARVVLHHVRQQRCFVQVLILAIWAHVFRCRSPYHSRWGVYVFISSMYVKITQRKIWGKVRTKKGGKGKDEIGNDFEVTKLWGIVREESWQGLHGFAPGVNKKK